MYKLREEQFTTFSDDVVSNAATGLLSFSVLDKYYLDSDERTMVNHGLGTCPTPGTTWDNVDPTVNPTNTTTPMFGTCDSFHMQTLQNMLQADGVDTSDRAAVFGAIFSSDTMTEAEYHSHTKPLAPYMTYMHHDQMNLNYTTTHATLPDQVKSGVGVRLKTETTLSKIQKCRIADGNSVLSISTTDKQTVYKFHAFVSKITAIYQGDLSNPTYSMRCDQQQYTFSASNRLTAVVAASTAGGSVAESDKVYVQSMKSRPCGSTDAGYNNDCHNTLSSQCKTNGGQASDLHELEYTVNLDTTVVNQFMESGGLVQSAYVAASEHDKMTDIVPDAGNCYGSTVQAVKVTHPMISGSNDKNMDIVRTAITFVTKCIDTTDTDGFPVSTTFAKCPSHPEKALDFSFAAELYKCTDPARLISNGVSVQPKNPGASTRQCYALPVRQFAVSMQYIYSPAVISKKLHPRYVHQYRSATPSHPMTSLQIHHCCNIG